MSVFVPYIGFTQKVKELCSKYSKDLNEIKRWYNSYLAFNKKIIQHLFSMQKFVVSL